MLHDQFPKLENTYRMIATKARPASPQEQVPWEDLQRLIKDKEFPEPLSQVQTYVSNPNLASKRIRWREDIVRAFQALQDAIGGSNRQELKTPWITSSLV